MPANIIDNSDSRTHAELTGLYLMFIFIIIPYYRLWSCRVGVKPTILPNIPSIDKQNYYYISAVLAIISCELMEYIPMQYLYKKLYKYLYTVPLLKFVTIHCRLYLCKNIN